MKKIYLPNLDEININNYSLYEQESSFSYKFKNGINGVIGANGIGKTTFVNIIIYCIVGHKKKKTKITKKTKKVEIVYTDEDFFSSRMKNNESAEKNQSAKATLIFYLGENCIKITRSLFNNKIIGLKVNCDEYENPTEEVYQSIIEKYSNISHFSDFELLIREFLFFDERRSNVAWEADSQDNILRILLLDEKYHLKINELEEKITKADTRGRHKSEDKRVAEESYRDLINSKGEILVEQDFEQSHHDKDRLILINQRNEINSKILEYNENIQILREELTNLNEELYQIDGSISNLSVLYDNIDNEIQKIETNLYKSIYNRLPDNYYTIEKSLITNGKCLMCNSKNKSIKDKFILKKKQHKCIICSSTLINSDSADNSEMLIEKLNLLNENRQEKEYQINNEKNKHTNVKAKTDDINEKISENKKHIDELNHRKLILESELSKTDEEGESHDMYQEILKNKEKLIDQLEREIRDAYTERDKYKFELDNYIKKFELIINNLNDSLSRFFNKYASTFIGMECKLVITKKMINRIQHYYYIPEIDGQERKDIWSVSESQRFFIDQAFRMAIIDYLKTNISNFSTFFITETPEGSLDVAYESQVAKMFSIFAASNNKIIFTSNLNSSSFLIELYKNIPICDRERRTLNLLQKGKMTTVQKRSFKRLEKIIDNIMGC